MTLVRSILHASIAITFIAAGCTSSTTPSADTGPSGNDTGGGNVDGAVDAGAIDGARTDAPTSDAGTGDAPSGDAFASDTGAPDTGTDAGPRPDGGTHAPMFHRPSDAQCQTGAPPGDCMIHGSFGMCSVDSDCTMGASGRCNENMGGALFCRCTYDTCQHDSDCTTGETCGCHGADLNGGDSNHCVPSNCHIDADCGAGGYCSPTPGSCGVLGGYYCHTPSDTCVDDTDCTGIEACAYDTTAGHWSCMQRLLCA
jgi:hypothetical protein